MNRLALAALLLISAFTFANAQVSSLICNTNAVPTLVRAEGITELLGNIVLTCSGGTPSGAVSSNLTVILPINVTNRREDTNVLSDVTLTIDNGGPAPLPSNVPARLVSAGSLAFNGLAFNLSPAGTATLRIANIRGNATQLAPAATGAPTPILAFLAAQGQTAIAINNNPVTVGTSQPGLFASGSATAIVCTASSLPDPITFSNLIAEGTRFATQRVTEGTASAFRSRGPTDITGTRVIVRYSGFPANARLFVPDAVAGSTAVRPTAGGDFGLPASGGQYTPGSGTLLLARVNFADSSGAGGTLAFAPGPAGSPTVTLDSVSEVSLSSGAGFAVYEVVDDNPAVRESAQIPTFLGLPALGGGNRIIASSTVSFAPVSTVADASSSTPVPRFIATQPAPDCGILSDCNAGFLPRLAVNADQGLQYTAAAGSGHQIRYVRINNEGGGLLVWNVTVSYQNGSNWLRIDNTSGLNNATIRIDALPQNLAPGTYNATVTVDAGPQAGARTLAVTLTVTAAPPVNQPPQPPAPPAVPTAAIEAVANAATFRPGPLAPGSLATIKGLRLSGSSVSVTFDGKPAQLLFTSETQINLLVPADLDLARGSAEMIVTVNGISGPPQRVALTGIAPGIFPGAVLNQDNSVNSAGSPAPAGSILQIFATGLPPGNGGVITAKVHDRIIGTPYYAGPAPGLIGVQQVNVAIPADLPAMRSEVLVCGQPRILGLRPDGEPIVCSPPATIYLSN